MVDTGLWNWNGKYGLPDFSSIKGADFASAFDHALSLHLEQIDAIANNPAAPDFENTIEAMELSGVELERVQNIFWHLAGTDSTPDIQKLERDIGPRLAVHSASIFMNENLFARIDALMSKADGAGYTAEQKRVLELHHKQFVKQGAKLVGDDRKRLADIDQRLASLAASFGQNVLADESDWSLILDKPEDLAGLPDSLVAAMAEAAEQKGHKGKHAVTLSRSIIEPFLTSSSRADLREAAFNAWIMRGQNGGETDNTSIIQETLSLRSEKAQLLGYKNFADLKLDGTMASTSEAVESLLLKVWQAAKTSASAHAAELEKIAADEGSEGPVKASDWRYFTSKLQAKVFDFDESELKLYFQLDRMIEAAFDVASQLFGISFVEQPDIKGPHEEARVFEVRNDKGEVAGVFIADYFARSTKRSGAWMSQLQKYHGLGDGQIPLIFNVMNFAKPAKGSPALLSFDDARTLFHEFGHALHGLLSKATYPSISGTSVSRDFVELPSQLYEHWLTVPDVLRKHALHVETGEPIPEELLSKVLSARTFNAGFNAVEFTSSAIVDMRLHSLGANKLKDADPIALEAEILSDLEMPEAIVMRHRSPHFLHVFYGDGYAAGYYSYMWSEVLDADAFSAFEETGNPFDSATADKLQAEIYSTGNSKPPEVCYQTFRGRMPDEAAMLKKRGLAA